MNPATTILINLVCNVSMIHVALAEAIFTQKMLYTAVEFDAAVDAAVESGLISESNNFLTVKRS